MSETAPQEEVQKKKKGKLPVLIVVAIMLFAGGFFGMKMRGGGKTEPDVKLGKIVEFEEKLYNLNDMQTWLRVTVAVHLREGYDEKKFAENIAPIEDAMNMVVRAKSPSQVQTIAGLKALKKELVTKINDALASLEPKVEKKPTKSADDEEGNDEKAEKPAENKADNDWESQTGPVLKLYFRAFAVQ